MLTKFYYLIKNGKKHIIKDRIKEFSECNSDSIDIDSEYKYPLNKNTKLEVFLPNNCSVSVENYAQQHIEKVKRAKTIFNKSNLKFPHIYAKSSAKSTRSEERLLQLFYFKELFNLIDNKKIIETIEELKESEDDLDMLRSFFNQIEKPNDAFKTKEYKIIKDNYNQKYDELVKKLIDDKIVESICKKISENSEKYSIDAPINEIIFYDFFTGNDFKVNMVSFMLDLKISNNDILEKLNEKIVKDHMLEVANNVNFLAYYELVDFTKNNRGEISFREQGSNIFISERNEESQNYEEFALALAYKNIYDQIQINLAEKTKLEEFISLASSFSKFRSKYDFKNPTKNLYYLKFYQILDLQNEREAVENKLDGIIKFIGLEHDKRETKKSDIITTSLTIIAIIFTFFGGFGAYPKEITLDVFWYCALGAFIIILITLLSSFFMIRNLSVDTSVDNGKSSNS